MLSTADIQKLFLDLGKLQQPLENGLSPRQCLEFCLKDVTGQVEGAEQGHAAGFAAGFALNTRQQSPRLFDRLRRLASFGSEPPTLSAEEIFEQLKAQAAMEEATAPTQQQILKMDPSVQGLFDGMDPTMQAGFFEAYLTAYREGYQKGLKHTEPKRKSMSQRTKEAIFTGEEAYTVSSERAESLKSGLLDKNNLEITLDQESVDMLSIASGQDSEIIQEAISYYASASEDEREALWSNSSLEAEEDPINPEPTKKDVKITRGQKKKSSRQATMKAPVLNDDRQIKSELSTESTPVNTAVATSQQGPQRDSEHDAPPSQDISQNMQQVVQALEAPHDSQNTSTQTHSEPAVSQNRPTTPNKPQTKPNPIVFSQKVAEIFNHSIVDDYKTKNKTMKSVAHNFSYKATRSKQMKIIDTIRENLQTLTTMSDQEKGLVLEAVMSTIKTDLKKEHRWTRLFGTKSRLEAVLTEDINAIRKDLKNFRSNPWEAMRLIQKIQDAPVKEMCAEILAKQLGNQGHILKAGIINRR